MSAHLDTHTHTVWPTLIKNLYHQRLVCSAIQHTEMCVQQVWFWDEAEPSLVSFLHQENFHAMLLQQGLRSVAPLWAEVT